MLPATTFDDREWIGATARGWSVMTRLRERQGRLKKSRDRARRRLYAIANAPQPAITKVDLERLLGEDALAGWDGHWTVLAFLFAMPDEYAIRTLDRRRQYFDIRTGDDWDLFFPGYFTSPDGAFESNVGSTPVGRDHLKDWWFNSSDFEGFRNKVEVASDGRWQYSGGADLVLINVWLGVREEPHVDWASIQSGTLAKKAGHNLQSVIEAITNDLQHGLEDDAYGVGAVIREPKIEKPDGTAKKVMIGAMGGIAAAIGKGQLGL